MIDLPKKMVMSEKNSGVIDEKSREIIIGNKRHRYRPNQVLEAGDRISIDGENYTVTYYNPTLFYRTIKRVAQIISPQDAVYMISVSGIRTGSNVLEIGVGSGNFSAYILWAVFPEGHLTMLDTSDSNIKSAISNLSMFYDTSGIKHFVGTMDDIHIDDKYDAVFADIPNPWEYMNSISGVMKAGSYALFYLPNFDQVEKTVLAFESSGLVHIESTELIKRGLIVRKDATRPQNDIIGHTAFITLAMKGSMMNEKSL